jgi:hypothetical protein
MPPNNDLTRTESAHGDARANDVRETIPAGAPDAVPVEDPAPPSVGFSPWQIAGALLVAAASDLVGGMVDATVAGVPATIPIDILTAIVLWAVLGRPVVLLVALIAEALPGIGVLPLWTAVVIAIAVMGKIPGRLSGTAPR